MTWSWYDLLMVGILVLSLVQGAWRGLVWQIAPIVSLVLGYVVAFPLSAQWAHYFGSQAPTNRFIALLVIYLAISFVVHLVVRLFRESIERLKMEAFDRHLGALFGGVKGVLFCLVVTFFAVGLSSDARGFVLKTRSGIAAGYVMHQIEPVLPSEVHDLIGPYIATLPAEPNQRSNTPTTSKESAQPATEQPTAPTKEDRPSLFGRIFNTESDRPNMKPDEPAKPSEQSESTTDSVPVFLEHVIRMVDRIERSSER